MHTLEETISVFRELSLEGGEIAMHYYGNLENIMTKADSSPLTAADLAIDEIIVSGLQRAYPEIPLITEERAVNHTRNHSSGKFFLIDPIDGTKEFINKSNEFTINIALIEDGTPVAGMVYAPALKRLFWGARDLGSFEETDKGSANKIAVRETDSDALIVVASRSHLNAETEAFITRNKVANVKNAGSSLKFCLIAAGEADIYPRYGPTMEWDIAAGHAVLSGAGGVVHTIDGAPISYGQEHYKSPFFIARTASAKYF